MRINFQCSGGFANLQLAYHADTDGLPTDVAHEILNLVESAGVFDIRQADIGQTPYGAADLIYYKLLLSDGERKESLECNDATAPDTLRPLLTHLRNLALDN